MECTKLLLHALTRSMHSIYWVGHKCPPTKKEKGERTQVTQGVDESLCSHQFNHRLEACATNGYGGGYPIMQLNKRKLALVILFFILFTSSSFCRAEEKERTEFDLTKDGFVRSWLIKGAFVNTYLQDKTRAGFDKDFLRDEGGEGNIKPVEKHSQGDWQFYLSTLDFIDLDSIFLLNEFAVAYAFTYIYCPYKIEATLRVGSDDGMKLWQNGSLIYESRRPRAAKKDEDLIGIKLEKGLNSFLVKVDEITGDWGFYFRVCDKEGRLIKKLKSKLSLDIAQPLRVIEKKLAPNVDIYGYELNLSLLNILKTYEDVYIEVKSKGEQFEDIKLNVKALPWKILKKKIALPFKEFSDDTIYLLLKTKESEKKFSLKFYPTNNLDKWWLSSSNPYKSDDVWTLSTTSFKNYTPTHLGNGYLGVVIPAEGTGFSKKTQAITQIAGLYNYGKLVRLPLWSGLGYFDGDNWFEQELGEHKFKQVLNMKDGYIKTYDLFKDKERQTDIEITFFVSREDMHTACIKYEIIPHFSGTVTFLDLLDATRAEGINILSLKEEDGYLLLNAKTNDKGIEISQASAILIDGLNKEKVKEKIVKKDKEIERGLYFEVQPEKKYCVYKFFTIFTSLESSNPYLATKESINKIVSKGFEELFLEHKKEHRKLWQADILVKDSSLQRLIHANLFYIFQSLRADWQKSIAPCGISSFAWGGHIFWDADLWVFPAILLISPELGRSIVFYRYQTLPGAKENAKLSGNVGAQYGWESAEDGRETAPPPMDKERHISSDVAFAQWLYYLATADFTYLKEFAAPIILEVAKYWASRVKYNKKGYYEIGQVIPPDEFAGVIDNSVFTNATAKWTLKMAIKLCNILKIDYPSKWEEIAKKIYLPFDEQKQIYLEYEGYKGETIKQADTSLLIFPFEIETRSDIMENIVDFYSRKLPPSPIMMSSAIYSIIYSQLGRKEEAYLKFLELLPHYHLPYLVTSESPDNKTISFVTGMGGFLQSIIYGFCGIRLREDSLVVKPNVPEGIGEIKLKNFKFKGVKFDAECRGNKAKVKKLRRDEFE